MDLAVIHRLMQAHPRTKTGFDPSVREAVARFALQQRQLGRPWSQITRDVGVSGPSIRDWIALYGAGFHEVVVVDEPETHDGLVITLPSGVTLTGCDLRQALDVLERLR